MEVELDGNLDGERLQIVGRGQLWDKLCGVSHVDLLAKKSGAQIEIEATLEMLSD